MRPIVRKEETMPDFMYGVYLGAEEARSGGERSEPERRAPSRQPFGASRTDLHNPEVPAKATRRRFPAKYKKIFFKNLMRAKVSLVR